MDLLGKTPSLLSHWTQEKFRGNLTLTRVILKENFIENNLFAVQFDVNKELEGQDFEQTISGHKCSMTINIVSRQVDEYKLSSPFNKKDYVPLKKEAENKGTQNTNSDDHSNKITIVNKVRHGASDTDKARQVESRLMKDYSNQSNTVNIADKMTHKEYRPIYDSYIRKEDDQSSRSSVPVKLKDEEVVERPSNVNVAYSSYRNRIIEPNKSHNVAYNLDLQRSEVKVDYIPPHRATYVTRDLHDCHKDLSDYRPRSRDQSSLTANRPDVHSDQSQNGRYVANDPTQEQYRRYLEAGATTVDSRARLNHTYNKQYRSNQAEKFDRTEKRTYSEYVVEANRRSLRTILSSTICTAVWSTTRV